MDTFEYTWEYKKWLMDTKEKLKFLFIFLLRDVSWGTFCCYHRYHNTHKETENVPNNIFQAEKV